MSGCGRQRGFTLLEMVIALTLLGLMMTVLFGGLRFAARGWDAAEGRVQAAEERFLVQRFLRRQLVQARPVQRDAGDGIHELVFEGGPESLSFVSPLPAHRGEGGLYVFTLAVERAGDADRLVARYRPFTADQEGDRQADEETEVLVNAVEQVKFAYYGIPEGADEAAWRDDWEDQPQLPELVRLEVLPADDDPGFWPQLLVPLRLREALGGAAGGPVPIPGGVDFGPSPPR